ncbi:MAG TPA: hypothetical protein VKM55_16570 [Candidatus Lokiarchaeia archaeon]|nr:hypothetical protein [Candidatus Lokiarchaeia archaeon]
MVDQVTLNDVRQFFAESNAATIGSKDLIQDTFIFPPGREDKIDEILDKLRSPTNLLLWGSRGVGKTLFLKKTYFDLLDSKNKSILPIFIDLNKVYHLSDSLAKASALSDADRIPLQNQLLERYYRVMIYRGVLECMKDRGLDNKVVDFLRSLFGSKETRKIDDIKSYLETEIIALGTPFSAQDLVKGKLTLSNTISYQDDVQTFLTNSYSEIFEKIYKTLDVRSFILIFDEFSMLPANLQDAMMSNVIQSLETKRQYTIYFKIAVMSGRYLIDTQTKDMYQHGFLPIRFEREYYDIFKGGTVDPDTAIDRYYEAVCLNRLRGMADRYNDFKGNPVKDGQQIVQLFTDPNGANCFKMLVNFAGYNFRRFFMFISNICNDKSKANYFTEEMILRQSNSYYTELLSKIKQNPELQQYSQCVDAFLNELVKSLPEDTLYFGLSDDQPFIVRTLEYFSIITQVTDKVKDKRKIPIYLLDLSTYVAIKELGLKELREKFAKGTLSIFRVGDIDKVIVFNTDDFKGIQMAYKIDDKFQELQHYYQDILDLEADLAAGEDKNYVAKSIQRILKKIDDRYKEKYTKETLEKKLKSYDSRSETILEADKTLKQEAKKEEQIASVQAAAAATAASEGYDKDVEFGKFSKVASMDARLLDELTKLKITYDQLKGYKGNAPKIEALTNQLPWDVRPTLTKVMAGI